MHRFEPGTPIAVRGHTMGGIRTAKAVVVVEDTPEAISYWWPAGSVHTATLAMLADRDKMLPHTMAELRSGDWELTTVPWERTDVLATTVPGSWAVVWHMWEHDTGEFICWYVDLKRPHVRTSVGFDTYDLDLDIVVMPDRSWDWKDEDEFAVRHGAGLITDVEVNAVRGAGESMIPLIEAALPPFDGSLIEWRPDPSWPTPRLPEDWDAPPLA